MVYAVSFVQTSLLEAIYSRRSIRRFRDRPVNQESVKEILEATIQAPSAKNAQPWRFVVLEGKEKKHLTDLMHGKADILTAENVDIGSLRWTATAMEQAPVAIVILNTAPPEGLPTEFREDYDFVMLQSTGGAIQTMLLAATELGLGSLWICDILYVADEVMDWLKRDQEETLVAAVSLGYAAEDPAARPRTRWQKLTAWRSA